jgi:hypothetical protein
MPEDGRRRRESEDAIVVAFVINLKAQLTPADTIEH